MAYKDSKNRLELVEKMVSRGQQQDSPYGDFCSDTIYAIKHTTMTQEQMESLLKKDIEDFFAALSKGIWCREAEHQMKIFKRKFNKYCNDLKL